MQQQADSPHRALCTPPPALPLFPKTSSTLSKEREGADSFTHTLIILAFKQKNAARGMQVYVCYTTRTGRKYSVQIVYSQDSAPRSKSLCQSMICFLWLKTDILNCHILLLSFSMTSSKSFWHVIVAKEQVLLLTSGELWQCDSEPARTIQ